MTKGQRHMGNDIDLAREVIFKGGVLARWFVMDLRVLVLVLDTRESYGRLDAHITPVGGGGTRWIASEKLDILNDEEALEWEDIYRLMQREASNFRQYGGVAK